MSGGTVIETLSSLAIVLAMILAFGAALARFGHRRGGAARRLRVIESLALGGRQRVVLIDADGESLLLGVGEGRVTLVRRLAAPSGRVVAPAADPAIGAPRSGLAALTPVAVDGIAASARCSDDASSPRPHSLRAILQRGRALPRSRALRWFGIALAGVLLVGTATVAGAETKDATRVGGELAAQIDALTRPDRIASTLEIVALLTAVSIAPSILLMATCFTRILIVFAFLRQAVGVPQLPPNQVLAALAFFTTLFVMAPVGARIQTDALDPYLARELEPREAASRAVTPVREFLLTHTRDKDLALFVGMAGAEAPETPEQVSLPTLLPAFMISELRTAFEIGFMIYLPFLVIDIVIASLLISMGMIVLPPIVISLPFKLMLFVLLDGWNLVLASLVSGLR